jgi:hypothetical protein
LILASTKPNAWILDPFTGSSTTGIDANLANRRFLGIDQEQEFLEISKKRKIEISDLKTANSYRDKIKGFIDKKQFSNFLDNESKEEENKVVLGFCRSKDLNKIIKNNTFYFHAIEGNNVVKDFPLSIFEASKLVLYSGGRSKPFKFTGYFAEIKSIVLKHKSKIKGKEKSNTEFYYEIILEDGFKELADLKFSINTKMLFDKSDVNNISLFKKFLPALTSWDRVIKSINKNNVNDS